MTDSIQRILRRIRSDKILKKIGPDSSSILMAVMEGRQITRTRYNNYHLIEGVYRNRERNSQFYKKVLANS